MDRRFLTVLSASLLFALVVAGIFYQMLAGAGKGSRQAKPQLRDVVVAARALPVGVSLKPADLSLAKVPADQFPNGGFSKIEEVLDRPVVSSILPEEPVREGRLAMRGSGLGLAPVIPPGLRAVAVKVNDVVGVAGFVLPGMRVDVLVTARLPNQEGLRTRTILQDILVASAGTNIEPDSQGKAIKAAVVTLLVTPEQAEILTLASENRIQLVLRNGSDRTVQKTPGKDMAELFGRPSALKPVPAAAPRPRPAAPPVAPPLPPEKRTEEVVVFRGDKKSVEQVAIKKPE